MTIHGGGSAGWTGNSSSHDWPTCECGHSMAVHENDRCAECECARFVVAVLPTEEPVDE